MLVRCISPGAGAQLNLDKRRKRKTGQLTVSQASSHAGWGKRVSLLGVHELADRGQLVDFSMGRGAGAIGGLRRHRRPGEGQKVTMETVS